LGKFKISPISDLIEKLTENITPAEADMSFGRIMRITNMGKSLIDIGKGFISSDSSPLAMVSRYFILSGIPMNQLTIINEIQNMISHLVENLKASNSNMIQVQPLRTGLENLNSPDWNFFEFITENIGRCGPSKEECIQYYNQKYTWITNSSFFDVLKEGFQTLTIPKSGIYSFEVIGPGINFKGHKNEECGARIKGKIRLERGEKITVALGQKSKGGTVSGSGGTFVIRERRKFLFNRQEPLFVAAGAGHASKDHKIGRASLSLTANGNDKIGSSGVQLFQNGDAKDFFCAGAGFSTPPEVGRLHGRSEPPQSYSQGLMGGRGYTYHTNCELEGGFGGGGASFIRKLNGQWKTYNGCGGGFTGGSSRIQDDRFCDGGGGGSFAADTNAKFDHKFELYGKCKITFLN